MDEKLYTLEEVAEHFHVSTKTIKNWLKAGKIKGTRPGRKWLFTNEQIRQVIQPEEAKTGEA
jgi:excisionase family DNA binding protein